MRDLKKVGRVGVKTLFYFEAVSTVALVMGLVVGKLLQPGKGFDIDPTTLDANAVASYVNRAKEEGFVCPSAGGHPGNLHRCFHWRRSSAGPAGFDPHRLRHLASRRAWRADQRRHRWDGQGLLWRDPNHRARGADRCVRRHGLHRRCVRGRPAREPDRADRDVLSHQHPVRGDRARGHRPIRRLLDLPLRRLHQGRTADRARHQFFRDGAAAHDPEDGAPGRLEIGCRPGDPDRLQLQSRRHQYLYDVVDTVPGAGLPTRRSRCPRSSASSPSR